MATAIPTTTEDSLRRRRERGRRAQAGFRKRQAEANQHVAEQNQRLRSAIEALVKAVHGDERPGLLGAISVVAGVAGVEGPRPGTTTTTTTTQSEDDGTNTVKLSSTSTSMSNSSGGSSHDDYDSGSSDGYSSASKPSPNDYTFSGSVDDSSRTKYNGGRQILTGPVDSSSDDLVISAATRDVIRKTKKAASLLLTRTNTDYYIPQQQQQQQQPPPPSRLMCGIWLDHMHYMRVSIPPDDILPYLGAGTDTFAGILFWSMMDHSQMKCAFQQHRNYHTDQNQHPHPHPQIQLQYPNQPKRTRHCHPTHPHTPIEPLIQRALSHSTVTADLAVTYIQAMIEARQEYRRTGTISARLASAAEPDLGLVMRDRISAEYAARGRDPEQWLSALGIANRVRGLVGEGAFALLEGAARGATRDGKRDGDGGGDGDGDKDNDSNGFLRGLFEDLACTLHETCICFGDGPRWSVELVDGLFLDWVNTALWSA